MATLQRQHAHLLFSLASLLVMLPGVFSDLSVDELWNWQLAQNATSLTQIFDQAAIDNNHLIISLYIWILKSLASTFVNRLLSLACGLITVNALVALAFRFGGGALACFVSLCGAFPIIHYASEARGYSALMLAVYATYSILSGTVVLSARHIALATGVLTFGALSHLTFISALLPALAVLLFRLPRSNTSAKIMAVTLVAPLSLAIILARNFNLNAVRYGGPQFSMTQIALDTMALLSGIPSYFEIGILYFVGVFLSGILIFLGVRKAWVEQPFFLSAYSAGVAFFTAPFLMPNQTMLIYPRYFLALFPGFLLLKCLGFIRLNASSKILGACIALATLTGLIFNYLPFFRFGRGEMSAIVAVIAANAKAQDETVWTDHDSRVGDLFEFYASSVNISNIKMVKIADRDYSHPPNWFITHAVRPEDNLRKDQIISPHGAVFTAFKHGENGSASGIWYTLYRYQEPDKP